MPPYSDPEEQKAYRRRWYRENYARNKDFRLEELQRKQEAHPRLRENKIEYYRSTQVPRDIELSVKVTPEEFDTFRKAAKRIGKRVGPTIRILALDQFTDSERLALRRKWYRDNVSSDQLRALKTIGTAIHSINLSRTVYPKSVTVKLTSDEALLVKTKLRKNQQLRTGIKDLALSSLAT